MVGMTGIEPATSWSQTTRSEPNWASGLNMHAHTQTSSPRRLGRRTGQQSYSHYYFHCAPEFETPCTCTNVKLLGPCFKTGKRKPFCSSKLKMASKRSHEWLWNYSPPPTETYIIGCNAQYASTLESTTKYTLISFASLLAISSTL